MPFDPNKLKEPSKSKFDPSKLAAAPEQPVEAPSFFESMKTAAEGLSAPVREMMPDIDYSKVKGAGATGAVFGAAMPELSAGLGKILSYGPGPVKAAGRALQAAAPFMTSFGQRAGGALVGGLTAAGGEAAKETAIEKGIDPKYANLIGIGVETLSPLFVSGTAAALRRTPVVQNVSNLFEFVAKQIGRDTGSLTQAERKYIALEADRMRGQGGGTGALYKELEQGAAGIETQATADAAARQQRAQQDALNKLVESGKQPKLADRITAQAEAKVHNIGNADTDLTTLGKNQRQAISDRFSEENLARNQQYVDKKAERDAVVSAKEQAGDFVENLPEYKSALQSLKDKLLIGSKALEQKTAPVTEPGVKSAYQRIYDAMTGRKVMVDPKDVEKLQQKGVNLVQGTNPATGEPAVYRYFPTSFEALDHVRRKLGDVAFGIEQEGYDALGQGIAKDWYKKLSEIQSKFAGSVQDELQAGYEITSGLLERFKGGPGAAVLKTEKMAPEMFSLDPKEIPARFFSSKEGPATLSALTGNPKLVEQTAADFVALNLKGKTAQQATDWIAKQEFLRAPELANLRPKIDTYVKDLEAATTRAEGVKATGKAQEAEAARIATVGEAEAKGISEEGRRRVDLILKDRFPEKRIAEILGDPSKKLWREVSTILGRTPDGKEILDRAVSEHLADLAVSAERGKGAVDALENLREPLVSMGLATPERINSLRVQLERMRAPEQQKLSWLANQFLRRGATVGAQYLGSAIGGLAPSLFGGQ